MAARRASGSKHSSARKGLDKTKRVKAVARQRVGSPKAARPLDERVGRDKPKHKEAWRRELDL